MQGMHKYVCFSLGVCHSASSTAGRFMRVGEHFGYAQMRSERFREPEHILDRSTAPLAKKVWRSADSDENQSISKQLDRQHTMPSRGVGHRPEQISMMHVVSFFQRDFFQKRCHRNRDIGVSSIIRHHSILKATVWLQTNASSCFLRFLVSSFFSPLGKLGSHWGCLSASHSAGYPVVLMAVSVVGIQQKDVVWRDGEMFRPQLHGQSINTRSWYILDLYTYIYDSLLYLSFSCQS